MNINQEFETLNKTIENIKMLLKDTNEFEKRFLIEKYLGIVNLNLIEYVIQKYIPHTNMKELNTEELQLHNFIQNNKIEINWSDNELIMWIPFFYVKEFTDLLGYNFLSDGGYNVNLREDCIAFDLVPICEYFDIEPTNILEKEI